MAEWQMHPVANPTDSRWQGRRTWSEVSVCAFSAAMARVIAGHSDEDPRALQIGNESPCFPSEFRDERLYSVVRLKAAESAALEAASGTDEIIRPVDSARLEMTR